MNKFVSSILLILSVFCCNPLTGQDNINYRVIISGLENYVSNDCNISSKIPDNLKIGLKPYSSSENLNYDLDVLPNNNLQLVFKLKKITPQVHLKINMPNYEKFVKIVKIPRLKPKEGFINLGEIKIRSSDIKKEHIGLDIDVQKRVERYRDTLFFRIKITNSSKVDYIVKQIMFKAKTSDYFQEFNGLLKKKIIKSYAKNLKINKPILFPYGNRIMPRIDFENSMVKGRESVLPFFVNVSIPFDSSVIKSVLDTSSNAIYNDYTNLWIQAIDGGGISLKSGFHSTYYSPFGKDAILSNIAAKYNFEKTFTENKSLSSIYTIEPFYISDTINTDSLIIDEDVTQVKLRGCFLEGNETFSNVSYRYVKVLNQSVFFELKLLSSINLPKESITSFEFAIPAKLYVVDGKTDLNLIELKTFLSCVDFLFEITQSSPSVFYPKAFKILKKVKV